MPTGHDPPECSGRQDRSRQDHGRHDRGQHASGQARDCLEAERLEAELVSENCLDPREQREPNTEWNLESRAGPRPDGHVEFNAEVFEEVPPSAANGRRRPIQTAIQTLTRMVSTFANWLFGTAVLVVLLAWASAIPVLQWVSLGYLLEASGRIARTGRMRDGFIGYRVAARAGTVAIGVWLTLLPIRLAANFSHAAFVVDPNGAASIAWRIVIAIMTVGLAGHAAVAVYAGGRLRDFFWPIFLPWSILAWLWRGDSLSARIPPLKCLAALSDRSLYSSACDKLWTFVSGARIPYFFSLGLRGYVATLVWIGIPGLIMARTLTGDGSPPPMLFLGGLLMVAVVVYLPVLQAHFAAEGRLLNMFQWKKSRELFKRAPVAFATAIIATLVLAIPLYLAKIEATSHELTWIANIVFVISMLPGRWLMGWAMSRARRRQTTRRAISCWGARILIVAFSIAYVFFISLGSYITWEGGWSFLQQHAFLIPGAYWQTIVESIGYR